MYRATYITSEETLPAYDVIANLSEDSLDVKLNDSTIRWARNINNKNNESNKYGFMRNLKLERIETSSTYPQAVLFILITKLFEAFAANGMRTIMALYLRDELNFSENIATILLHLFNFFGQFCPIFGAILADSYIGNVRSITLFYYIYGFGWLLLILTSLPNMIVSLSLLIIISLLLIAIGNGSSRACLTSLGAQQFRMPDQAKQLSGYFSLYYLVYYIGIFLSKVLPPIIRVRVRCFHKIDCYTAVFGSLAIAFFISWCKFFYRMEKMSEENVLLKLYGCIKYALIEKWNDSNISAIITRKHTKYWLHYAIGNYETNFVNEVDKILQLIKLFLPLAFYYALLTQQDSSWTFQASLMNCNIIFGYQIQPDQVKALGPIFLFILIPFWQYFMKPFVYNICHFELKPLQSVGLGGIFAALSFLSAGLLENYIQILPAKSINIAWQIPQFLLLMLGELLLSIPGLQFAFTQAPMSMKSVVTAAWFLNNAFGNLIVILCTQFTSFSNQTNEFFFYAIFMMISIIVYVAMASNYIIEESLDEERQTSNEILPLLAPTFNNQDNIPCESRSSPLTFKI